MCTVYYSMCGIDWSPPLEISDIPKAGDIISPFNQNYQYYVLDVSQIPYSDQYKLILYPYCDTAKRVFESQYIKPNKPTKEPLSKVTFINARLT